jgi:hypothetical protein
MGCPTAEDAEIAERGWRLTEDQRRTLFRIAENAVDFPSERTAIRVAVAEIDRLTAERDEAREWVRRLTESTAELRCAFCGQVYPPGTPASNHEALTAHIKVCPKHPMRALESECERLRAGPLDVGDRQAVALALSELTEARPGWSHYLEGVVGKLGIDGYYRQFREIRAGSAGPRDIVVGPLPSATAEPSITCPDCGMTSYHPEDIAHRYCGKCHKFH